MNRIILSLSIFLAIGIEMNAQSVIVNAEVEHPSNKNYKAVLSHDTIYAIQGSNVKYTFEVIGLDSVENVVSCQYSYKGNSPVDAEYVLNEGVLTINEILFNDMSVNEELDSFSLALVVKEKNKEENTTLPLAKSTGIKVFAEPTCDVSKEPIRYIYEVKTNEPVAWELTGKGGGKWFYTWTSSSGQQGTHDAFTIDEINSIGETKVSVMAVNYAPDNTTVWGSFEKTWKFDVYGKADVLGLSPNIETAPLQLFQNQNWILEATPVAGFPAGWSYEWKDVNSGKDLGNSSSFTFDNPTVDEVVCRHVELLVRNVAEIGNGQTEEWFNQSYHFYVNFYPLPIVTFDNVYPINVLDGDIVEMGFVIQDPKGNSIKDNQNYVWSYKWKDGSHSGTKADYSFNALNTEDNDGLLCPVTLTISGLLTNGNGDACPEQKLSHTFTVWPKPVNVVDVPVNTESTPIEYFQTQTCSLGTSSEGGYKSGWTYEWKDSESGSVLSHERSFVLSSKSADDVLNRHVVLTVMNTAPTAEGQTKECFKESYDYYVNFHPAPVVSFEAVYPSNVLDGDVVKMALAIKDPKGNSLVLNPSYTWSYEWKENSVSKSHASTYDYIAGNSTNYDGVSNQVVLNVLGKLNGVNANFSTELSHTFTVWPKPVNVVDVPVNTESTPIEYFQTQTCSLGTSSEGGYKSGWTYEWKDSESGSVLSHERSFVLSSKSADDVLNRHIVLTVMNTAPTTDSQTKEWFKESYNYYVNFHPTPVVSFEAVYPSNVLDGDVVKMALAIKDPKGNSLVSNPKYTWSYEWKENSVSKSHVSTYNYIAGNSTNYDGVSNQVVLSVLGKLNGVNANFSTELSHKLTVWPKPMVTDLSSANVKKVECGGRVLDLRVNAIGGQKTGWTCQWSSEGKEIDGETNYSFTKTLERSSTSDTITEWYSVRLKNICENVVRMDTTLTYSVLLYPQPWKPQDVTIIDANRDTTPLNAIREGNKVKLLCDSCYGGYPNAWVYEWSVDGSRINNERNSETTISAGYTGDSKDNSKTVELKCLLKNAYNDIIWEKQVYTKTYTVYKRPQTPLSIVKKGNGSSGTVIATTKLSDDELLDREYYLVFGYIDANGKMTDLACERQGQSGEVRWSKQFSPAILKNSNNIIYVYALWKYESAEVTSGLRTLNTVDENWDGSDFSDKTRSVICDVTAIHEINTEAAVNTSACYSLDGRVGHLTKGMNIVKMSDGRVKKVFIK